jgi:hypothetical protein
LTLKVADRVLTVAEVVERKIVHVPEFMAVAPLLAWVL